MTNVLDIMTKSPAVCMPDTPLADVARMMVEHDCGAVPVVGSQSDPMPLGIVTDRDIVVRLVAEGRCPLDHAAKDAMSQSVATVHGTDSLDQAAQVMEENQVRRVPVIDEQGHIIGIVSQADIALNATDQQTADVLREVSEDEELLTRVPMGGTYSG
ncbi:MAG: CBS domain-containing protein [Cytophagales bacterium]|nr:CBS domain-containing protein [Armatimonadota bacterium]